MTCKATVEPWDCTFEADCDCPECQLVNDQAEEDAFNRLIEANNFEEVRQYEKDRI